MQNVTDINGCEAISISGSAFVNVNPLPEANFSLYPQPADILNPQITFTDDPTIMLAEYEFYDGIIPLLILIKLLTYIDTNVSSLTNC